MLIREPIITERLILRPEGPDDADAIHAMNSDLDVMRHIGDGHPWTSPVEGFRRQFRDALARNADNPWGGAAVLLRQTGQFIGLCWLAPSKFLDGRIELGYRYVPAAWGRGLATEAARVVVAVGFEHLHMDAIMAVVRPDNSASIRVLEKLAFRRLADRFHPQAACDVGVYELTATDWVSAGGRQ